MENNKSLIQYILNFFQYCENERDFSEKTIENYGRYLNRFISWLKSSNLAHLTPQGLSLDTISRYKEYLSTHKIKSITINYYLIAIRALLSYLSEKDIPCPISLDKIKLPKIEKRETKQVLTSAQLEKILNAPNVSHDIGLRDKTILGIICSTGLKVAELARINKNDVKIDNFTNRAVIDVSDKRGGNRTIFIPLDATGWLIKYLNNRKDNDAALFINYRPGKVESSPMRLTSRSIERIVQKYSNMIDFSGQITPESLRNAYIKSVFKQEPDDIKTIYNHQNLIIKRYSPNLSVKNKTSTTTNIKNWSTVESQIKKEITWLKTTINTMPERYQSKDVLITCEECVLRKIAILIVSGKVQARKMKFEQLPWEHNLKLYKKHAHGEEWHRKMMNAAAHYFKKNGYPTSLEPALNMGRADIGAVSKSSESPIYIEIGTTSLYKLLYNLLTTKNSIFLILPTEENMIEFKT